MIEPSGQLLGTLTSLNSQVHICTFHRLHQMSNPEQRLFRRRTAVYYCSHSYIPRHKSKEYQAFPLMMYPLRTTHREYRYRTEDYLLHRWWAWLRKTQEAAALNHRAWRLLCQQTGAPALGLLAPLAQRKPRSRQLSVSSAAGAQ